MLSGSPQSSPSLLPFLCSMIPAAFLFQGVSSASLSYFVVSRSPFSFVVSLSFPIPFLHPYLPTALCCLILQNTGSLLSVYPSPKQTPTSTL